MKFLLALLLIPVLIFPIFTIPTGYAINESEVNEFCSKIELNNKTNNSDILCKINDKIDQLFDLIQKEPPEQITNSTDITQLEKDITRNSETIISLNNTVNQLTVRINELTILHYPAPVDVLVPPVPELVPLPEQPLPGDNPEFAPNTPENFYVIGNDNDDIRLGWDGYNIRDFPRGVIPPTYIVEYSVDGVNWISIDSTRNGGLSIYGLDQYTEYLVKVRAVNEFGMSQFTVIGSGIPALHGNGETGYILSIKHIEDSQYIKFNWRAASWLFGYERTGSIIEKSINYGNFTKLVDVGDEISGSYTDFEVEDGNVYSYRIQTTTTNEVHTRSGFNSILYTLD